MSFTATSTDTSTTVLYLSPSKRKRVSSSEDVHGPTKYSAQELYNWTFTASATALCSIRDALEIPESTPKPSDFFWLGSVPCTSVRVVGMVVGIQVYEKRIIYTLDDGTGVIDCQHVQPTAPIFFSNANKAGNTPFKYRRTEAELPQAPKPICRIGSFLRIAGRLQIKYESRQITVKEIEVCSANDELHHTRAVRELHKTLYSSTSTFRIPAQPVFSTPKKATVPPTPATVSSSRPSSISSSPVKPGEVETPLKKSPVKLRHPSRLHTHDLTENIFRIYLKHYMDHAPIAQTSIDANYDSDTGIGNAIDQIPSTPTKRTRVDATPRPRSSQPTFDATPRARIPAPNFSSNAPSSTVLHRETLQTDPGPPRRGFSLSYLRRVPELSLLASRVVDAVGRRKLREERRKMKEAGFQPSHTQKAKRASRPAIPPEEFAKKKKRLFQWAVVQLLKEGCIALWDGPVRPCPDVKALKDASRLWKPNTSHSSTLGDDNTLFSMSSSTVPSFLVDYDDEEGALSDPDPNEEAYVSLTADYLAEFVEAAIKTLVKHYEKAGKPYSGASKEAILVLLQKDDRWQHVGEWNVAEALQYLQTEGRVWAVGKNGWDLTE
ncbi:hypothetical protein CVT26_010054 [Gymnopilus dilepis]|uniref:CST complex subunit STN1 n=1 Tax=Gymnopilus dilepis TaxID=231916 RepID=A0A409VWI4_9AGAR|nr:hypothetical protein CVT26_010054 [Gymnopilus dilepis]